MYCLSPPVMYLGWHLKPIRPACNKHVTQWAPPSTLSTFSSSHSHHHILITLFSSYSSHRILLITCDAMGSPSALINVLTGPEHSPAQLCIPAAAHARSCARWQALHTPCAALHTCSCPRSQLYILTVAHTCRPCAQLCTAPAAPSPPASSKSLKTPPCLRPWMPS